MNELRKCHAMMLAQRQAITKLIKLIIPIISITVEPEIVNPGAAPGEDPDWYMVFTMTSEGGLIGKFTVFEPMSMDLQSWQNMADGVPRSYGFYCGNGEGRISISHTDNGTGTGTGTDVRMTFTGAPSGAGGDVSSEISIPHHMVKPHLQAAIDKARELHLL